MPAIKATNSRGLQIINCTFSGFETDVVLENVEDFVSKNNTFSHQNIPPQQLINNLINAINGSSLDNNSKRDLFEEMLAYLATGARNDDKKQGLVQKIGTYLGNKAVDYFVQLAAAVSAGLIISKH